MNQLRIKYWNYKISRYGKIVVNESESALSEVPFRYKSEIDNQKLNINVRFIKGFEY